MKKILFFSGFFFLLQAGLFAQEQGNVPAKNTSLLPLPEGPSVLGVFDGRTPCRELAGMLNEKTIPECIKIKWRLVLYRDPDTQAPSTYTLEGFIYRNPPRSGKWQIIKGAGKDRNAVVYQLDPDKPAQSLYFYKGDDNVLFFLDRQKNFMVGYNDFSYTLNRTGE